MSENEQKGSGKVIRASSGSTRLTAGNSSSSATKTSAVPAAKTSKAAPAAPKPATTSKSGGAAATQVQPSVGSGPTGGAGKAVGSGPTGGAGAAVGSGPTGGASTAVGSGPQHVQASSGGVKMSGTSTKKKKGPRTVKLTVGSVDPWSVMKMSFLMSAAVGIATIVAFLVLWIVMQATGVLDSLEATLSEIAGSEQAARVVDIFSLGRVLSAGFILALINVVLMTALSTLFAFLYNIGASITGGLHLTLTDD